MNIKTIEEFNITGRGQLFSMSLKENGFSAKRSELKNLNGQEVLIDGKPYQIRGVEAAGIFEDEVKDIIGILVRPRQ